MRCYINITDVILTHEMLYIYIYSNEIMLKLYNIITPHAPYTYIKS